MQIQDRVSLIPGLVLVLGGAGFIGSRLVSLLTEANVPVQIGDLKKSASFSDLSTECDVRNAESVGNLADGAESIINLAAEHRDDVRPLSRYHETNVGGAVEVCKAATQTGVKKIIFASSVAVYGFQPVPVDENGPFEPFNEYGKTKLAAEEIYRSWANEDPSRTLVIVRPTVVFGEGNRGNVHNLLRQIASGRFVMTGPGTNVKSMAYVGNVAAFLFHALSLGQGVHIFNYVDGPDMSTNELVEYIQECLNRPGKTPHIPMSVALAGGHLLDIVARITGKSFPISAIRVRKFCESTRFQANRVPGSGFTPPYSLREGLGRTIRSEFLAK